MWQFGYSFLLPACATSGIADWYTQPQRIPDAIPRYARDGRLLGYIGSATDIHELRETPTRTPQSRCGVAHLSRIATAGVLSASVAYGRNQLLASIQNNAEVAKLPLTQLSPDLEEVQQSLNETVGINQQAETITKHLRLVD
jgi:hypothetical protein